MFSSFKTKKKLIAISILAFVSVLIYAGLLWVTNYTNKSANNVHMVSKETAFDQFKVENIRKFMDSTAEEREFVSSLVLTNDSVVSFIEEIENLGKVASVETEIDSVGAVEVVDNSGRWERLRLSLSIVGEWVKVYHFLTLIENLPYETTIERSLVEWRGSEYTDSDNYWLGEFTISILKFK